MFFTSAIKRSLIIFSIVFIFASCTKECTNDTTTTETPPSSKLRLLTANVWIYDSVYTNWGMGLHTVAFVRNSINNIQDWSKNRVKLYIDGSFNEILNTGALRQSPDTWSMNADSTILYTTGGGYSNSAQIISLTSTRLVWYDVANKMRGVQIPKY